MNFVGLILRGVGRAVFALAVLVAWLVFIVAEACSNKE
jgi:hypothetical protein